MIAYTGFLGAGKTLNMTKDLFKMKKKGAFVLTNYTTLFSDMKLEGQNEVISAFQVVLNLKEQGILLKDFLGLEKEPTKIVFGLDEASIYFNSKEWKNISGFEDLSDFLFQCRKLDVDILYTAQFPGNVHIDFRRLTEMWMKFSPWRFLPFRSVSVYELPPEGTQYSQGELKGSSVVWAGKSKVFDMYDTKELIFRNKRADGDFVGPFEEFKILHAKDPLRNSKFSEKSQPAHALPIDAALAAEIG